MKAENHGSLKKSGEMIECAERSLSAWLYDGFMEEIFSEMVREGSPDRKQQDIIASALYLILLLIWQYVL